VDLISGHIFLDLLPYVLLMKMVPIGYIVCRLKLAVIVLVPYRPMVDERTREDPVSRVSCEVGTEAVVATY
jgi:hypothetical protein